MADLDDPYGTTEAQRIEVDHLLLDPQNPRLITDGTAGQLALLSMLYEQEGIDELAPSFAANGYFEEEPLVVVPDDDRAGYWIVVEGNRRLATLKLLLSADLRAELNVVGWPELGPERRTQLLAVPCVIYRHRDQVLPFLGFRHITGAKKWAPFQKARFIEQLIMSGRSIAEVEAVIGDSTQTVKKLYQDFLFFEQATAELPAAANVMRDRFSLVEVVLGQRPIKQHLGLPQRLPVGPIDEFVPADRTSALIEVVTWVFGDGDVLPVVSDSREINSKLAPVVGNPEALAYLRATGDLDSAYEYSDGEKAFLLKRIAAADRALKEVSTLAAVHASDEDVRLGIDRLGRLIDGLRRIVELR